LASLKPVYVTTVVCSALGAVCGLLGIDPSVLPVLFLVLTLVAALWHDLARYYLRT